MKQIDFTWLVVSQVLTFPCRRSTTDCTSGSHIFTWRLSSSSSPPPATKIFFLPSAVGNVCTKLEGYKQLPSSEILAKGSLEEIGWWKSMFLSFSTKRKTLVHVHTADGHFWKYIPCTALTVDCTVFWHTTRGWRISFMYVQPVCTSL